MIRWVSTAAAIRIHDNMIAEFGGLGTGVRDINLLESALSRPKQTHHYSGKVEDFPTLAAQYAFSIAKNHPFVDANKRTALQVMELFLGLNGMRLRASDESCVEMMVSMAASEVTQDKFAEWVKRNTCLDAPAKKPVAAPAP